MRRATPGREARQQPAPRARLQPIAQVMPARAAARARRSPRAPQPARRSQRAAARATQPPHRSPRRPSAEHTACPCPSRTRRRDEHTSGGSQCTCCFVSVARRVGGLASVVAAHTGVGAATAAARAASVRRRRARVASTSVILPQAVSEQHLLCTLVRRSVGDVALWGSLASSPRVWLCCHVVVH
jgi:hypothetical protein